MYNNSNYLSQNIQYENMPQFYANYNYSNLYEQPQVNRYNDSSGFNKTFEYNQSDVTSNQLVIDVYQREKDTELINNFIDENSNLKADKKFNHKEKNKKLGITQIKSLLSSINKLNVNLKEEISSLEEEKFKLDTEELNEKLQKCMRIKMEVEKLSLMIREDDVILKFKKLIDQRKKKRMREKKLRAKWKASKLLDAERRDRLHAAADAWIRDKQDVIEREKQEENLRKDADMILSDIRNKRSDARKYLSVLNELKNLRKVKSANARARGEKLSVAADQAFENIIGKYYFKNYL